MCRLSSWDQCVCKEWHIGHVYCHQVVVQPMWESEACSCVCMQVVLCLLPALLREDPGTVSSSSESEGGGGTVKSVAVKVATSPAHRLLIQAGRQTSQKCCPTLESWWWQWCSVWCSVKMWNGSLPACLAVRENYKQDRVDGSAEGGCYI